MEPRIQYLNEKTLIGMRIQTSVSDFESPILWKTFMQRKKEIKNRIEGTYFSIQIYQKGFLMKNFSPTTLFEYWSAIEVLKDSEIPEGMDCLKIPEGKYAVFIHKGTMSEFQHTIKYIHTEWIPNSKFELDERPHFELLSEKYLGPTNPDSEEQIWVPIKL